MTESLVQSSPMKQLLVRVVVARQLTSIGVKVLDDIEPSRQLLSLFRSGSRAGKATAPEASCAIGASAHADDVMERFRQQKGQELK
jgi:hypothetical protein